MKNTINPFSLGSNVMIEIIDGNIRQLKAVTLELIKEMPIASLNDQQIAAIEKARQACADAAISQGFQKSGYTNEK